MATRIGQAHTPVIGASLLRHRVLKNPVLIFTRFRNGRTGNGLSISRIGATGDAQDSYFDMWKKAVDRERNTVEFERLSEKSAQSALKEEDVSGREESEEELETRRNAEFNKLLHVSVEERDRVQRTQVIDRAAAAIAAARALLKENLPLTEKLSGEDEPNRNSEDIEDPNEKGNENGSLPPQSESRGTPGPSFWSWLPPPPSDDDRIISEIEIQPARQVSSSPVLGFQAVEKDREFEFLSIPLEPSMIESNSMATLPPLQPIVEVNTKEMTKEAPHLEPEREIEVEFSINAAEAVEALSKTEERLMTGVNPDGKRWWKETGVEQRPDGVLCKWTLTRGVSADATVEWENKYWEAANELGYKELGSEKSGRDAAGNVWHEYWRESMNLNDGVTIFEKTADKWGKNVEGDEWQEQWYEHYDASGQADKWAHKWCSIDPSTPVDAGHAHVWHERWGEKYDGKGGSVKYTDKWAERKEGEGWSKWGDKWDENFNQEGHGVKQGESWWEGKYGDRWNRTWGEGHNGSGWVHKYGKSSSGEHWDTHQQQQTWYEKFPHFGFHHCYENSIQLREVKPPQEI